MTDEQKLQDYEARLELVKIHLGIDYKYSTLISFENELEKFIKITSDKIELNDEINDLEDEVSDLEDEVSDLKKELKELKNKNLKNNEN